MKREPRIDNIGSVFQELSTKEAQDQFQQLFTNYHKYFDHASPVLKDWAFKSLDHLNGDMAEGYIPLPREVAAQQIGRVYESAKDSIVAANVGGTKFYFDSPYYQEVNRAAAARGVPIVRFYLFSSSQRLLLRGSSEPKTYNIDEFFKEVQQLHKDLQSVYSVVIDVDHSTLRGVKDMLLLDNKFVAATEITTTDWQAERALATERDKPVEEAREYFRDLQNNMVPKYVIAMPDDEIKKKFHGYEGG